MTRRMKRGEKRPEHMLSTIREISDDDETSAVIRPYGMSESEKPDDMVSIPDHCSLRQRI